MEPSTRIEADTLAMDQALRQAIAHHQAGQLQEAGQILWNILQTWPDHPEANHNVGMLLVETGQSVNALSHFRTALEARPDQVRYWSSYIEALIHGGETDAARQVLEQGLERGLHGVTIEALARRLAENNPSPQEMNALVALFANGNYGEAASLAQTMTERFPLHGVGWKALGVAHMQMGRIADALIPMQQAAALSTDDAQAFNNLGATLQQLGRLEEAEASYRRALEILPDYADAHSNLAVTLKEQGRLDEAETSCRQALQLSPDDAEALSNLAGILNEQGRLAEAEASYKVALRIKPDNSRVHNNLAGTLQGLGRLAEAEASYRRALQLQPDYPQANCSLGAVLIELGRLDEAETCYRQAIRINPESAEAYLGLGMLLHKQLRNVEAGHCFTQALMLRPDSLRGHLCNVAGTLPILYGSSAEIDVSRQAFSEAVDGLAKWYADGKASKSRGGWRDVGHVQNFYLAYQGLNDRDLQRRFGQLMCAVMADHFPEWAACPHAPMQSPDGRLRIGIVSAHFRDHSNWKIPVRGWVEHIARDRFCLFGYHTGLAVDRETDNARCLFDRFYDKRPFLELCKTILADKLDVLIYPGLGMDQDTWQMAALRLAPIQCTSWGHPVTSGLPTIDYFLSSDLMEPPDGAEHYCEQLVRLPNLSIHYTLPGAKPLFPTRHDYGFPAEAVIYYCPQSPQKYLPQNDALLIEIARRVPQAKFVFLSTGPSAVSGFLMDRLHAAFARAGLSGQQHLMKIPTLDSDQFQAMSQIVDVLLDTPDWSGCNSTLELLAHGLPVVTLPGRFMRGRHTLAILRMIQMDELIAATPQAYVDLAVRLGTDSLWRNDVRERIVTRYPGACGDLAAVRGLESFLEDAVMRHHTKTPHGIAYHSPPGHPIEG